MLYLGLRWPMLLHLEVRRATVCLVVRQPTLQLGVRRPMLQYKRMR